jgi:FKBP-type peptidyl-prolyl cis-trans isomerase
MNPRAWLRLLLTTILVATLSACTAGNPEQNLREGEAFLAENAKQPGVVTTATGLQYLVLQEGTGLKPAARDSVTVNYKGSLVNGREFDRGDGISFPLAGVIPGWTEGLQSMKEGAKYRFFIPPRLAYGESGAGRVIPPNATLIFEVELTKVNR